MYNNYKIFYIDKNIVNSHDVIECSLINTKLDEITEEIMGHIKRQTEIEEILGTINEHLDIVELNTNKLKDEYKFCMPTIPNKIVELRKAINEMIY